MLNRNLVSSNRLARDYIDSFFIASPYLYYGLLALGHTMTLSPCLVSAPLYPYARQ